MALVNRILTLHYGKITVHTSKGEGTVFVVLLPNVDG
jgi:signal transduction histidine kinase